MTNKTRILLYPFAAQTARGRRGIALVVVLGLLALLVMVGVAFSIFMRTERHAAGSFQHDVRARQLLHAARVKAIETLETNLAARVYPDWIALVSPGSGITLATNQVWAEHIPDNLLLDPAFPTAAGWMAVTNGRVGFLIVNASGLLDANSAGAIGVTRATGVDPAEIAVSSLSEMDSITAFVNNRPYESVGQMKRAGSSIGLKGVSQFVTFSMSPTNVSPEPLDISGTDAQLSGRRAAIVAMLNAKFSNIIADDVMDALLDYVDADSVPRRLDAPCTERVPMINEINLKPAFQRVRTPPLRDLDLTPRVEFFYPFVSSRGSAPFRIECGYTITCASISPAPPGLTAADFPVPGAIQTNVSATLDMSYGFWTPSMPKIAVSVNTATWANVTATFKVVVDYVRLVDQDGKVCDQVTGLDLSRFGGAVSYPSITVPALPTPQVVPGHRTGWECIDPRYNHINARGINWYTYAMLEDPREGFPVFGDDGSLGSLNVVADRFQKQTMKTNYDNDGHPYMHVADAPLKSVGELSFLPRGGTAKESFWNTLRLISRGTAASQLAEPLFECFTVPPAVSTQRGFVNPNTDVNSVLQAAFFEMPLDCYPGEIATLSANAAKKIKITAVQAAALAQAWKNDPTWMAGYSNRVSICGNTAYLNEMKKAADAITVAIAAELSFTPAARAAVDFRKEAGIRNLIGLLNPRQNYFIIILFAQSSAIVQLPADKNGNRTSIETVRSDQTGLLELWRDPLPRLVNLGGGVIQTNHPMFIRRFDILAEE